MRCGHAMRLQVQRVVLLVVAVVALASAASAVHAAPVAPAANVGVAAHACDRAAAVRSDVATARSGTVHDPGRPLAAFGEGRLAEIAACFAAGLALGAKLALWSGVVATLAVAAAAVAACS